MKRLLIILIQPLLYLWFIALILCFALPVVIFALPFNANTRFKITAPMWVKFFRIQLKTVFFTNLLIDDRRDDLSKKRTSPEGLYIANHQSFGDIPVLFSRVLMAPIMKKQVLYIPVLGLLAYASGAIVVDREDKDSRKKVFEVSKKELTSNRRQLQYYPEGTRRKDGGFGPKSFEEIKYALIQVAFEYNVPVYPISIYGTPEVVNGGLICPGQKTGIILHEPLHPHEFAEAEVFAKAAWQKVIDGFFELDRKINLRN
ncbi:MAG: 1-acyl-sn-glycerol-3-phosphate acyltransferase [Bdellovibrionota bacterium]|nr:1-acyl-sn-glycerol-3-phosphate acyltransferase [Bdellovibrionota bacterium]